MTGSLFSSEGLDPATLETAREELRRRLPELRTLPGFPIGTDEDILAMSLPPYYTACPNPFIDEWLQSTNTDGGSRAEVGPYVSDVVEGKTDLVYRAHSFWTKVPHRAIARYILHYTEPGDVVLDGFAGSGMTGAAAMLCASPDPDFKAAIVSIQPDVRWGERKAVLQDLSPVAGFIGAGVNLPIDPDFFDSESTAILEAFYSDWGWMYETDHSDGRTGRIEYTVWSEVFTCPHCAVRVVFYDVAFDENSAKVRDSFNCRSCGSHLTKRSLERRIVSGEDPSLGFMADAVERVPVQIAYRVGNDRHFKTPDDNDLAVHARVQAAAGRVRVPTSRIPYMHMTHERNNLERLGVTHVAQFWPPRARIAVAELLRLAGANTDPLVRTSLVFWVEQMVWGLSWMNRYMPIQFGRKGGSQVNTYMTGVYYIGSLVSECSPRYNLEGSMPSRGKRRNLIQMWSQRPKWTKNVMISTGSSESLLVPDQSVDYVFVDPPFGENIYYADLNYLIEQWHGVVTNSDNEVIVSQNKRSPRSLVEYQAAMSRCFSEFNRVLKPGRWMTVVFSNSSNDVWLAIQKALSGAGFVVADTRILDKDQLSYRQVTAKNAVKQDLIISAYKPSSETLERFSLVAESAEGAWEFVREHLSHLPVSAGSRGEARVVRERMADRLWDRMCAFHIQRGLQIPMTATQFYAGLEQRFPVRGDMYFLSEQVEAYERHRMTVKNLIEATLFITNEQSAVQWLRQFLKRKPRTYAEIQPVFFGELQAGLPDWEELPELRALLEGSFLQDDQGRWYVLDPKRSEDLERLRTRALLREFEAYVGGKGRLARFRSEAVRAGFKEAWGRRDFATIVAVGRRLPDDAFVEDEALLYYYDNARRLAAPT